MEFNLLSTELLDTYIKSLWIEVVCCSLIVGRYSLFVVPFNFYLSSV